MNLPDGARIRLSGAGKFPGGVWNTVAGAPVVKLTWTILPLVRSVAYRMMSARAELAVNTAAKTTKGKVVCFRSNTGMSFVLNLICPANLERTEHTTSCD